MGIELKEEEERWRREGRRENSQGKDEQEPTWWGS